jgi:tRNA1(Val) A37 N6-methylase TrmN6
VIHAADRLPDLLAACDRRLGSLTLLPLAPREGRAATRLILQARKGGRGAFRLLAPFVLHQDPAHDGDRDSFTPAARAILRDGAALAPLGG